MALYRRCSAIVGNSSSTVIEASFLKVAGVLVGPQQVLREFGPNVLRIEPTAAEVRAACLRCLEDEKFRELVLGAPSIYGDGFAAPENCKNTRQCRFTHELLRKTMTY